MTERPKGSGTWRLRVYVGRDPDTNTPIQESRTFRGTETAARKELAKLVAKVEGRVVEPNRATVGQLLDRWVAHVEAIGKARPKTVYEYRRKIDGRIRPVLVKSGSTSSGLTPLTTPTSGGSPKAIPPRPWPSTTRSSTQRVARPSSGDAPTGPRQIRPPRRSRGRRR